MSGRDIYDDAAEPKRIKRIAHRSPQRAGPSSCFSNSLFWRPLCRAASVLRFNALPGRSLVRPGSFLGLALQHSPGAPASTGNMNSLAHRTVASTKQLHSLTHRTRRAMQEKVSRSNPPLTESVRGGKNLTPFIVLYVRCSFGEARRFLFCASSVRQEVSFYP